MRSSRVEVDHMRARLVAMFALVVLVGAASSGMAFGEDPSGDDDIPPYPSGVTVLTTVQVNDEASYRQALIDLSSDASGPHTIDVTADITLTNLGDPTYT